MKSTKTFNWFRKIGIAEGVSFLILLLIAMPLKYFAGLPIAVTIVGALHGALFIAFMLMAMEVSPVPIVAGRYTRIRWLMLCFVAAILPFGTFVLDKRLVRRVG